MGQIATELRVIGLAIGLGILGLLLGAGNAFGEQIHACVKGGKPRVVSDPSECKNNETALSWNIAGEPGPQAPKGDKGDKGDMGDPGPAGADGAPGMDGESPVNVCASDGEALLKDGTCVDVVAMQEQIAALSAKSERLMQCLNTDRYVNLGLTVFDCQTWLEWEKKTADNLNDRFTWSTCSTAPPDPIFGDCEPDGEAFDYIAQLNTEPCFAGKCDWRLPEMDAPAPGGIRLDGSTPADTAELETILLAPHPCGTSPCIDPVFGPTAPGIYLSSVTSAGNPNDMWFVWFNNGAVAFFTKSLDRQVRAVRTGP